MFLLLVVLVIVVVTVTLVTALIEVSNDCLLSSLGDLKNEQFFFQL